MEKILLVEDDPFLIEIYSTKIKKSGFSLDVVTDGSAVIKKLEEKKFNLILLDIVLPNMNGWEVLRLIKNDSRFDELKIVILSNLGEKEDMEKGLRFGVTKYLVKSQYTPSEVVEEIRKILNPKIPA